MSGKAERAAKRSRRLSTDSDEQEEEYDWSDRRQRPESAGRPPSRGRAASGANVSYEEMSTRRSRRNVSATYQETTTDMPVSMSRGRRNVSNAQPVPIAKVSRQPSSSPSSQQSLHFTVKLPASKLRQATGMAPPVRSSKPSASLGNREHFVGGEIIEGKRARNVKKSYVLESDSEDEEEDVEMEDVADDDDAEGESVEEEDEEEEEEEEEDDEMADQDAVGEDDDADGDVEMDIPPPPPTIKISRADKGKKPTISVKPTGKSDGKTVEAKEAPEVSDDEELSELESEVEEEEGMQLGNEEDAEGEEEEDLEEVDDEEEEDDELDSDDETPAGGSRASTPDLTKLTKRQRARLEEGGSGHLLALPDEVQVKKHLTAEEHAMRRAEMARRRKNLSEKRNEEEKMETINKLLKKQAPKTNSRRNAFNGIGGTDASPDGESPKPNPIFVRWISNKDGNRIGVPDEWLEAPVGAMFTGSEGLKGGKLIEEVQ